MTALSRQNGLSIDETARLAQAIGDILTTPIGSRVGVPDYGSLLFDLIDGVGTAAGLQQLRAATVDALKRWEPGLTITAVDITTDAHGQTAITIDGETASGPFATDVTLTNRTVGPVL